MGRLRKIEGARLAEQQAGMVDIEGDIPAELVGNQTAINCYQAVVNELKGSSVIANVDKFLLVQYAETWSDYRRACEHARKCEVVKGAKGNSVLSPWARLRSTALDNLRRLGAELGLSPASRKRMSMAIINVAQYDEDDFELSDAELREIERRANRTR